MTQYGVDSAKLTAVPVIDISFRQLWNCCWGKEEYVVVMQDDQHDEVRHAVCRGCALSYVGPVELLPTQYNTVPGMSRYPVRPFALNDDFVQVRSADGVAWSTDKPVLWEGDYHLMWKSAIPGEYEATFPNRRNPDNPDECDQRVLQVTTTGSCLI